MRRRNKIARKPSRHGAAAVEFAIIAPLMLMFTFGLIEIGRVAMVKQTAIHASREGARAAVHPSATESSVLTRVNDELVPLSLTNAVVEFEPTVLEDVEPGELVTVRVKIDTASISWLPGFFSFDAPNIEATSTMRRESTF